MGTFKAMIAFAATVGLLLLAPAQSAQAGKPTPYENHGQCVSSSAHPNGPGGRSDKAKDKSGCAALLQCAINGDASFDPAADTATASGTGPGTPGSAVQCSANIPVEAGDEISFDYSFAPGTAPCGGGVPRVYVRIGDTYYNTFDDDPNECGAATGSYILPVSGTVTEVGFVYDRGDFGSVTYSNTMIGDLVVDLS